MSVVQRLRRGGSIIAANISTEQFIGTMAEAYSRGQKRVRAELHGHAAIWLNLVNGSVGYLPPEHLYDVDIYPAWQTPFDRGSLELVEDAAVALGRELLASAR